MTFTVDQTWLSIDSSLFILSGTHSQVTDLSTTITITAFDPKGLNGAQTINILLKQNMPPVVLVQPISLSWIAAHSSLLYTIPFSNFKEPKMKLFTLPIQLTSQQWILGFLYQKTLPILYFLELLQMLRLETIQLHLL